VGPADEGDQVVLAHRAEWDVLDHDHLVVVRLEHDIELIRGFLGMEACEKLLVHFGDPTGCLLEPVPGWVFTDRLQNRAHRILDSSDVDRGLGPYLGYFLTWV
jgi:hypothetical protein